MTILLNVASGAAAGAANALPVMNSSSLQLLLLMTALTVLPTFVLMMTSFTRIIIVLAILRQAIGLQQSPPNSVLVGLALVLSLFVMRPVLDDVHAQAVVPYQATQISLTDAARVSGARLHQFMQGQVRKNDLALFMGLARQRPVARPDDVPMTVMVPAFVTSELKTAFQIGFMVFLPFLVIDLLVAATLMALGMMMLSPQVIALPFKLLLFVMIDGWALIIGSLANSFA